MKFDIPQDVYYGHIEWDLLLKTDKNSYDLLQELPKYPSVRRDLALLLDREVKFRQIRGIGIKNREAHSSRGYLFDVYESDNLGNNKKSYAVSFILRDEQRTLTDKNIDKVMTNLDQNA